MDTAWARIGAICLAGLLLVIAAARLFGEGDEPAPPRPRVALEPSGSEPRPGTAAKPAAGPWVHVAGAVRRPGLYRVSAGARVAEALARAGGPSRRADLTAVNLAAPVEDGQQVVVVARGRADGGEASAGSATGGAPGAGAVAGAGQPVSLSQASLEQLDGLDGIGPTLAARILAYGKEHGGFRSVEQLQEVEGIGPKRFEALQEAVRP